MKSITLRYGCETRTLTISSNATIGSIVTDSSNKVILGYGDNVKALVNGVEQTMDTVPQDGCTVTLETMANKKAI